MYSSVNMKFVVVVAIVVCVELKVVQSYDNSGRYSEDELPPLFQIDDLYECKHEQGIYCKADIHLEVYNTTSKLAEKLKLSHENKNLFDRSALHRMICIPRHINNPYQMRQYIKDVNEKSLKNYNVSLNVNSVECHEDRKMQVYDYLTIAFILGYTWFIVECTRYDRERDKSEYPASRYDKWLKTFSWRRNWNKINEKNTNPDFQRLKSFQGLRTFNMILIILCHTKLCILMMFHEDPKSIENLYANIMVFSFNQLDLFIVQVYFLTSCFLLTNQILDIYHKNGRFSLENCLNLIINRILRFLPTTVFMVMTFLLGVKFIPNLSFVHLVNHCWRGCTNFWWGTVFQLNFFFTPDQMCNIGAWYLSVDTFLYFSTVVMLYVHLNFNVNLKKMLLVVFVILSVNYSSIIYSHNLYAIIQPVPESMTRLLKDPSFYWLYINPFANWSTSVVGIALGYVYFHTKSQDIKLTKVQERLWFLTFVSLPILAVLLSTLNVKGITSALLGPLLKPMFALGVGIGVLGMSKGYGGAVKKILEWDVAVKFSNFTYCTYLYHFFLLFILHGRGNGTFRLTLLYFITSSISDVVLSFIIGTVMTVGLEYPFQTLQKMYIPQIKKNTKQSDVKK